MMQRIQCHFAGISNKSTTNPSKGQSCTFCILTPGPLQDHWIVSSPKHPAQLACVNERQKMREATVHITQ